MSLQISTASGGTAPSYPACVEHGVWSPIPVAPPGGSQHLKLKDVDADEALAIKKRGTIARPWRWEIYAPCKSTPVQASDFFVTMSEATRAGKVALSKLRNSKAA